MDVLSDVAARDGFPITGTNAQKQTAFTNWVRYRLQQLYREQAKPRRASQTVNNLEAAIETEAQTIT